MITFELEGVLFQVDHEAYELGRIVLPDDRLFMINGWFESNPPKPMELCEVVCNFEGTLVEKANHYNAVLATIVDD